MVAPQMVRSPVLEDFRKHFQVAMRRSGRALRVVREGFRSRGEIDRESVLKDVRPGLQCRCCLMLGVVSMPLDRGGSWVEPIVSCSEVQRIALIGPVFQRSCSAEQRRHLSSPGRKWPVRGEALSMPLVPCVVRSEGWPEGMTPVQRLMVRRADLVLVTRAQGRA